MTNSAESGLTRKGRCEAKFEKATSLLMMANHSNWQLMWKWMVSLGLMQIKHSEFYLMLLII